MTVSLQAWILHREVDRVLGEEGTEGLGRGQQEPVLAGLYSSDAWQREWICQV